MAIFDLLQKAENRERLSPSEFDEVRKWAERKPEIIPSVRKIIMGKDVSDEERSQIQDWMDRSHKGDEIRARGAKAAELRTQAEKIDTRPAEEGFIANLAGFGKDAAAVTLGSGGALVENLGQLGGLVLPGVTPDNPVTRAGKQVTDFYEPLKSPELRASEQAQQEEIEAAGKQGGFTGALEKGGAAVSGMVKNPMALGSFLANQLPLMVPAAAAGRGAVALGAGAKTALGASLGTGAALQGASVGGGAYEELMSPEMDALWAQVPEVQNAASDEERAMARQSIAMELSRKAGGAGAAFSLLSNLIPGGSTVERVTMGAGKKVAGGLGAKLAAFGTKVAGEVLQEGVAEEGTGQIAQNLAVKSIDPNKDVWQGVGEAVGLGAIGGGLAGAPAAAAESFAGQGAKAAPAPVAPAKAGGPLDTSAMDAVDKTAAANIAGKKKRNDVGFQTLFVKSPDMAAEADVWRKQNPMGGPDEFLAYMDQKHDEVLQQKAANDPKVKEAEQGAAMAQAKAEAGQNIAQADPTGAPPAGLTQDEAVQAMQDGGAKLADEAKAAQENVRTVEQTVAKTDKGKKPSEIVGDALDSIESDHAKDFAAIKKAMAAGAMPFDEQEFLESAGAAGLTPVQAFAEISTIKKTLSDKASKAAEKAPGFTPDQGSGSTGRDGKARVELSSSSAVIGNETMAMAGSGKVYPYQLAVVPMAELKTSDMAGYPAEVQPRDRTRFTANETVRRIGRSLNPDVLMNTPTATDGPPVIGADMVVEGGNGRVMGMRLAKGTPGWDSYQEALRSRAQEYGIDPAKLDGITDPVLVRVRSHDVADRGGYARELNQSMTNALDPVAQAKADAAEITPALMNLLSENSSDISSSKNREFVAKFISTIVSEADRPAMFDKSNQPSKWAIDRIRDALFSLAYAGSGSEAALKMVSRAVQEPKAEKKNLVDALHIAAPLIAKMESKIAAGEIHPLSISTFLMDAMQTLYHTSEIDMSVEDFLAQEGMFGNTDPLTAQIMVDVDAMRRSLPKLSGTLKEYARIAIENGSTEESLFGGTEVPTPATVWKAAFEEVNDVARTESPSGKTEDQPGYPDLFEEASQGAPAADLPGLEAGKPGLAAGSQTQEVAPSGWGEKNTFVKKSDLADIEAEMRKILDEQSRTFNSGAPFNPKLFALGIQLAAFHIEAGARKFGDMASRVAASLGRPVSELMLYLPVWYNGAKDQMGRMGYDVSDMDSPDQVAAQESKMKNAQPEQKQVVQGEKTPLVMALESRGGIPKDNRELAKWVKEIDGQDPDGIRLKEAQEAVETIIALRARQRIQDMIAAGADESDIFTAMQEMYQAQPLLNIRTSVSIENQAYSTPAPLAYLGGVLCKANLGRKTYDPTAGNGMLLISADPTMVSANELDAARYRNMGAMGFSKTRNGDAVTAVEERFIAPKSVDTVIANPPFGKAETPVQIDGQTFSKIDHIIAAESLRAMKDNGRATLIIGASKDGPPSLTDKVFLSWLGKRYNVVGNFEVEGSLYTRQGASWPVRILVVNGRGGSAEAASKLYAAAPRAKTWEEVYQHGSKILDSDGWKSEREPDRPSRLPDGDRTDPTGGQGPTGGDAGGSGGPVGGGRGRSGGDVQAEPTQPVAGGRGERPSAGADTGSEPAPVPDRLEIKPAPPASSGTIGSDGGIVAPDGARSSVGSVVKDADALIQPYTPAPYMTELDQEVFVPTNLMEPLQEGNNYIAEKVGDVMQYLASKLNYTAEEIQGYLMGLQAESVAAAIYNIENRKGTIIADKTGIGKGRQGAAVARYCILNGIIPVYITKNDTLFTSTYTDLLEIGTDFAAPYIMNDGAGVDVTNGDVVTRKFVNRSAKKNNTSIVKTGNLPDGLNMVITSYTQFNKANIQRQALHAIAPKSVLILDESHLAAGEESGTGEFFRGIMNAFQGTVYMSATWAKRASNMVLFSKTAIGDLGMDADELLAAVSDGGYALQGIISQALARYGQFFRRERSFDNVEYDTVTLSKYSEQHAQLSDQITGILRKVMEVEEVFAGWFEAMEETLTITHGGIDADKKPIKNFLTHQSFGSVVHHTIDQLLLALKVDECVEMVIQSMEAGEAPTIALTSTMEAMISDYAAENGLKPGDTVPDFTWKDVLSRNLRRTRYYNIKKPADNAKGYVTERIDVSLDELPAYVREEYEALQDVIDGINIDLPASPIDAVRHGLEKVGYKVAEITGRKTSIDYSGEVPVLRGAKEGDADRNKSIRDFNNRAIDVLIFNAAGSTGINLHADKRWTTPGQRGERRHMFILQGNKDINEFMQSLGRVDRTGQTIAPRYSVLALALPAENRVMSNLQKKVKTLNSSTNASTQSSVDLDGVDLLNVYGDHVVQEYLLENPRLAEALGFSDLKEMTNSKGQVVIVNDIASKALGHLALMPVETQRRMYEEIEPRFKELWDVLTRTGQNKLVQRTMDYQMKTVSKVMIFPGTGNDGPFSGPAYLETASVKPQGKTLKASDVAEEIKVVLAGKSPAENRTEVLASVKDEWNSYLNSLDPETADKALAAKQRTATTLPTVGDHVTLEINGDEVMAVVTQVGKDGSKNGNPYASSKWFVRLATNSYAQHIKIRLAKFRSDAQPMMDMGLESVFKEASQARRTTQFVTGNIFGAYKTLNQTGEIISATNEKGEVVTVMEMPKSFTAKEGIKDEFKLANAEQAYEVLRGLEGTVDPVLRDVGGNIVVSMNATGNVVFELLVKDTKALKEAGRATGLVFTSRDGRQLVADKAAAIAALKGLKLVAARSTMQDAGLMEGHELKPEAFDDPVNSGVFDAISESTIRMAVEVIQKAGGRADLGIALRSLEAIQAERVKLGSLVSRVANVAAKIESGDVNTKELRSILKEIAERMGKVSIDKNAPLAYKKGERVQNVRHHVTYLATMVARAAMLRKMDSKFIESNADQTYIHSRAQDFKTAFPFLEPSEYRKALGHCLFLYNESHSEDPFTDLKDKADFDRMMDYIGGVKKMNAFVLPPIHKLFTEKGAKRTATIAAGGFLGMAGLGMAGIASPGLLSFIAGGTMAYGFAKLAKWTVGSFMKKIWSPSAQLISEGSLGFRILESIQQTILRTIEIAAPANALLDRIELEVLKVARAGGGTTAEIKERFSKLSEGISDYMDASGPIPQEVAHLAKAATKIRSYFGNKLEAVGGKTLEDYFHRVYDFEGLQALKADPYALERLAVSLIPQILQNDPDGVDKWMERFPDMPKKSVVFNMALAALTTMYDDSKESKESMAIDRATTRSDMAYAIASKDGELNLRVYNAIMESMKKRFAPFTAGAMKKRVVNFQLPKEWKLSDGTTIQLVDRDFVGVTRKYIDSMSKSLAQKEVFDANSATKFLGSKGPVGSEERNRWEWIIRQSLNNRVKMMDLGDEKATDLARTITKRWKMANSIMFLGLNAAFPLKNMVFGSGKALLLSDPAAWARSGAMLAKIAAQRLVGIEGKEFTMARDAGAVFHQMTDAFVDGGKIYDALMYGVSRSQQAVDVTGYFLGRVQAPKVVKLAMEKDPEAVKSIREVFGPDRAAEILDEGHQLTEADLNRFGLAYRNWISGTGNIVNLPRFMSTESGRFWFQMMTIPLEDTKFFVDRVHGVKGHAKYWSGVGLAGLVLAGIFGMVGAAFGGDDEGEDDEKSTPMGQFFYDIFGAAGGFQSFQPLVRAFMAGEYRDAGKQLALSMLPIPVRQAADLVGAGVETAGNIGSLGSVEGPGDAAALLLGPSARFVGGQVAGLRQLGVKVRGASETEKELRAQSRQE